MSASIFSLGSEPPPPELKLDEETSVLYGGAAPLGKGATSVVYPCLLRKTTGEEVTVSEAVLRRAMAESMEEKNLLEKEMEIWEQIPEHKNVLALIGYQMEEPARKPPCVFYSVTERLDGDLEDLIFKDKEFASECTYRDMLRILQDICGGLIHLHENNIIHHDLKPRNVLISRNKRGGVQCSKIIDFGASKVLGSGHASVTASLRGTWDYMAPEVVSAPRFRDSSVRFKAAIDIYSLGALIWVLLNKRKVHSEPRRTPGLGREIAWGTFGGSNIVWCNAPAEFCDLVESCVKYHDGIDASSDFERPSPQDVLENLQSMADAPWVEDRVAAYTQEENQEGDAAESGAGASQQEINSFRSVMETLKEGQQELTSMVVSLQGDMKSMMETIDVIKVDVEETKLRTLIWEEDKKKLQEGMITAAKDGKIDDLKALLASGAQVDARDKNNFTPLIWAACKGHLPVVEFVIEQGADVNAKSAGDNTALIWAAGHGHLPVVEVLLVHGASVESRGPSGTTPLMSAAYNGHLPIVEALTAAGADIDAKRKDGKTALKMAAEGGESDIVSFLEEAGAEE